MGLLEVLFKSAGRAVTRAAAQKVNEVVREKSKEVLDDLIPTNSKPSQQKSAAPAQNIPAYDTTPDLPQPFGYKLGWLCIKGKTPEEIISILGLKNAQAANWESGLDAVYEDMFSKVFVSPVINGYVLAVGYVPFGVMKSVEQELKALDKIAAQVDEMTCFTTQRTVDIHVWAKYVAGKLIRGYGWIGESGDIYLNRGEITPEEINLGFTNLIQNPECDWDTVDIPDEEYVMNISAAWGVDTSFTDGDYETGTGFVCDIV